MDFSNITSTVLILCFLGAWHKKHKPISELFKCWADYSCGSLLILFLFSSVYFILDFFNVKIVNPTAL